MRVVAFAPKHSAVQTVVVEGTREAFKITFREEWPIDEKDRIAGYVSIRKRVVERVKTWAPDAVCVAPYEPASIRHGVRGAMFETAELRGVVAEGARSVCALTAFRSAAKVSRTVGDRKSAEYVQDDEFWSDHDIPKKYRGAVLIALSYLAERSGA